MKKAIGLLALLSSAAWAQYPITSSSQTYQPLVGGTAITSWGGGSADEGSFTLALPFTFTYYGVGYTTVYINTNGFVTFGAACTSSCYSRHSFPDSMALPKNMIAPWWGDHDGAPTLGTVSYKTTTGSVEIEWLNWGIYFGTGSATFKLVLNSSGSFQAEYGTITTTYTSSDIQAGFEDTTGTQGTVLLACSSSGFGCDSTNFPSNTVYLVGRPIDPDLAISNVGVSNVSVDGAGNISLNVQPTIVNYGQTAANNFGWRAFLSTDTTLNPTTDILIYTSPATVSLGASTVTAPASTQETGSATTSSPPPAGNYYVLVEVDNTGAVAEASEANNVGSTLNYFSPGIDLVAQAITAPVQSGPGNVEAFNLTYANQGATTAGTISYKVLLSANNTYEPSDFVLDTRTRLVTGGETISEPVNITIPNNAPGGDFYVILVLDPSNTLAEGSETNNAVSSSTKITIRQADLVTEAADWVDPVTGSSSRVGYFGQTGRAKVQLHNTGGANANNFKVAVVISTDATPSFLSDTIAYEYPVTQLVSGATVNLDFTFTVPLKAQGATQNFASGNYFIFVVADSTQVVTELNEPNNTLGVNGQVQMRAPAPDLTVTRLEVPATAAVGELMPVLRTLKNIGSVDATVVKYRYYASASSIITSQDDLLPIVSNGTAADYGQITLAQASADTATELVRLPATLAPGVYYIGCIVDSDNSVVEQDELNNTYASSTVQVVASSLRVATSQLPDVPVGRPYSFRLVAMGEQGTSTSTWALQAGSGTLPSGLTLSAEGLISGTPTETSVNAFTVLVQNAGREAAGRLVLRVLPNTTEVEITTTSLPSIANTPSVRFEFALGAAGGVRPYTWKLSKGTLPNGITMTSGGLLAGAPKVGSPEGSTKITVTVQDSVGSRAERELTLRLVAPGGLSFLESSLSLPYALVGADYLSDIAVENRDGTPLARPLKWTMGGELPEGLALMPENDVVFLSGKPARAGSFGFSLSVEDARGRTASADFVVRVFPPRFSLTAMGFPDHLTPGQRFEGSIVAGTGLPAVFSLSSGTLPPGLTLSESGALAGTVEPANSEGVYNFVVEAQDSTGASGLGAFTLEVKAEPKSPGCSTTPGLAGWLLLFAVGPWLLRRVKTMNAMVKSAAVLLAVVATQAQAAGGEDGYLALGPNTMTYSPVDSTATTLAISPGYPNYTTSASVTLPFQFKFYGTTTSQLTVSYYGMVVFSGSADYSYNYGIPSGSSYGPTSFIAGWWDTFDDYTTLGTVKQRVYGTSPNRSVVFQWDVAGYYATQKFSFQVILFEGSNMIRLAYGNTAPVSSSGYPSSASVGIQKSTTIGLAGLSCTSSSYGTCTDAQFPTGKAIDMFLPADLTVTNLTSDAVGYAGVPFRATATLKNIGGKVANNSSVRFYLSTNPVYDSGDLLIGDSSPTDVAVFTDVPATVVAPIPSSVAPGQYFLLATADPDNVLVEQSETNNAAPALALTVGSPTPDLVVAAIQAPTSAQPGQTINVTRVIRNGGNAASGQFKYTYVLSDNSAISISDTKLDPIGTITALAAGTNDTATEAITLPSSLAAGQYWVGLCVNYDGAGNGTFGIAEISQVNNCTGSNPGILLSTGQLSIVTTTLLPATQYSPYGMRLQAAGGDGNYHWVLSGGQLPLGMSLTDAGDLVGTPAKAGAYSIEVKVTSAGASQTAQLVLQVTDGHLPLAIVDQDLQPAEISRVYNASLIVVGGKPPYVWNVKADSALPKGLALATDGRLEGRATEAGEFGFAVEVTDSANSKAAKDLMIRVVNPTSLHIALQGLPTGYLNKQYLQLLSAVGGRGPYDWSITRFQQLPESATEAPGKVLTDFPENFGLKVLEDATGQDFLRGTPKQAGLFAVTLKVTDSNGSEDITQLLLRVSYEAGLAITTTALPDAFVGHDFQVRLSHNGGDEAKSYLFTIPCLVQANKDGKFGCAPADAKQALPPGLMLFPDGAISGQPNIDATVTLPAVYTFLVKVTDENGRQDVRGLAIKVRADFSKEVKKGCSGTGLEPSLLGLLLLAASVRRRRRG